MRADAEKQNQPSEGYGLLVIKRSGKEPLINLIGFWRRARSDDRR